jgi:hypothetical protein
MPEDTPFSLFHNRLRIMLNIDKHDLDEASGHTWSMEEWRSFQTNPWRWFIETDSRTAEGVFALIEAREARWAESKARRAAGPIPRLNPITSEVRKLDPAVWSKSPIVDPQ